MSNSKKVIESIPQSERAKSVRMLDSDHLPSEHAPGIQWNIQTDRFEFSISMKTKDPTRLGILAVVSSIYNPFGLAAPLHTWTGGSGAPDGLQNSPPGNQ